MNGLSAAHGVSAQAAKSPLAAWARSGLMALSGLPEGAPAAPPFDAMSRIEALLEAFQQASAGVGARVACDVRLLTERAVLMQLSRQGATSCNRSCRLIETQDGWIAVNLPRERDLRDVPAFVGCTEDAEPWSAIESAARGARTAELVAAGRLLGLAVAHVKEPRNVRSTPASARDVFRSYSIGARRPKSRDWTRMRPLVVDLSALWAGPLCAQLLADAGARVIKVESIGRPDTVRHAAPDVFDRLNAGKKSVALDFTSAADLSLLKALLERADIVISSARPRAFEQLGLEPGAIAAMNPGLTWVAITAYGWMGSDRNAVGYGDDAAAAAGLLTVAEDGRPLFAGDAIADPLTGIAAAIAAIAGMTSSGGLLIDAILHDAAAFVASAPRRAPNVKDSTVCERGTWGVRVAGRTVAVAQPQARPQRGRAAAFGTDTQHVLTELGQPLHEVISIS